MLSAYSVYLVIPLKDACCLGLNIRATNSVIPTYGLRRSILTCSNSLFSLCLVYLRIAFIASLENSPLPLATAKLLGNWYRIDISKYTASLSLESDQDLYSLVVDLLLTTY